MELPTYTNIWKIEKRLYKLYDFRLPMPLPVGQIAAFLAIAVPYTIILTMAGMPFSHTWLWVYVLPPGVLAWLVTRPVLEGKRLPELVTSQLRYLTEPRTWCRMAPLAESDEILLTARVWRAARYSRPASQDTRPSAQPARRLAAARPERASPRAQRPASPAPPPIWPGTQQVAVRMRAAAADSSTNVRAAWPRAGSAGSAVTPAHAQPAGAEVPAAGARWPEAAEQVHVHAQHPAATADATVLPSAVPPSAVPPSAVPTAAGPAAPPRRPVVRVTGQASETGPLNVVERALRATPGPSGIRDPVVVVPGGHRPGKPDQVQRDQARARLALPGPARIVVLGCTAGAGQTVTTLLTGQLLASLRGEPVAVLDLSSGAGSLTEQARAIPVLMPSRRAGGGNAAQRGLQVVTAGDTADDPGQIVTAVAARYPLTLADPDVSSVPRTLRAADQLLLVAPATAAAAGSLAMTLEWLEAHDHAALAAAAVTVLNGVSQATADHAEKAASVASGRTRATVRVPWDANVRARHALATTTIHAYTALAGVLVTGLADATAGSGAVR